MEISRYAYGPEPHVLRDTFAFRVLGQTIGVECTDARLRELLAANWSAMACDATGAELAFRVHRDGANQLRVSSSAGDDVVCSGTCELINVLEHQITIRLQLHRPDLLFLHAAALERNGQACLLVAASGAGKSTAAWGLVHHNWTYLSDELAPIRLDDMRVYAYPRAICLKRSPPQSYPLPRHAICVEHSIHIPLRRTAIDPSAETSFPIAALMFIQYCPEIRTADCQAIGAAEAATRIYANGLNQLAHPNRGLTAAVRVAQTVPGFLLRSGDLAMTCEQLQATWDRIIHPA